MLSIFTYLSPLSHFTLAFSRFAYVLRARLFAGVHIAGAYDAASLSRQPNCVSALAKIIRRGGILHQRNRILRFVRSFLLPHRISAPRGTHVWYAPRAALRIAVCHDSRVMRVFRHHNQRINAHQADGSGMAWRKCSVK